jgi:hypothetical protein
VREAFARLGIASDDEIRACGIRLLKMGMPLPFEAGTIRSFARGLREVFVIEEKQPNIEALIKDALYGLADRPLVVGKSDERGEQLLPGTRRARRRHPRADPAPPDRGARPGVRLAPEEILPGRAVARSTCSARRSSARAARTTAAPRCPKARSSARASAATRW